MTVWQLTDRGVVLMEVPAGLLLLFFLIWGLIMAVAGGVAVWLSGLGGRREHVEDAQFTTGHVPAEAVYDSSITVQLVPRQRVSEEYDSYTGPIRPHGGGR